VQERVVAFPVLLEGEPGPVRLVDVQFDPEARLGPVGVDLEALDEEVHRGLGQPRLPHDLEEALLEPRAGEGRLLLI
jgi:hypothetical protein